MAGISMDLLWILAFVVTIIAIFATYSNKIKPQLNQNSHIRQNTNGRGLSLLESKEGIYSIVSAEVLSKYRQRFNVENEQAETFFDLYEDDVSDKNIFHNMSAGTDNPPVYIISEERSRLRAEQVEGMKKDLKEIEGHFLELSDTDKQRILKEYPNLLLDGQRLCLECDLTKYRDKCLDILIAIQTKLAKYRELSAEYKKKFEVTDEKYLQLDEEHSETIRKQDEEIRRQVNNVLVGVNAGKLSVQGKEKY